MSTKVTDYMAEGLMWQKTADPRHPYELEFEGERCVIRVNDFPDEHLYTLIVNEVEAADFDDWPMQWMRPQSSL